MSIDPALADLVADMLDDLDDHDCDSSFAYRNEPAGPDLTVEMLDDLDQHSCESAEAYRARFETIIAEAG